MKPLGRTRRPPAPTTATGIPIRSSLHRRPIGSVEQLNPFAFRPQLAAPRAQRHMSKPPLEIDRILRHHHEPADRDARPPRKHKIDRVTRTSSRRDSPLPPSDCKVR